MTPAFDSTLQDAANYYLRQLRAGDFESAFHGLIDLDPAIVHPLIAAYHAETAPAIRSNLLRIIWEFRTPLALPLLSEALRDRRDHRWKVALTGLVTLASAEAVETIESALSAESAATNPDADYIAWVREALEQARQAQAANSDVTGYSTDGSTSVSCSISFEMR